MSFDTAARNGEPFESVIQKYGIPNASYPHCNRELKLNPMMSYIRSIGWKQGAFLYAIGIRADEVDRMSETAKERGLWYPLVRWGITKSFIRTWWSQQRFDLDLPEHKGNCDRCWKKSDRKLLTLAKDEPVRYDWWRNMETRYANAGAGIGPRVFYRNNRSALDILAESQSPFAPFVEKAYQSDLLGYLDAMDVEDSCGAETCEAF